MAKDIRDNRGGKAAASADELYQFMQKVGAAPPCTTAPASRSTPPGLLAAGSWPEGLNSCTDTVQLSGTEWLLFCSTRNCMPGYTVASSTPCLPSQQSLQTTCADAASADMRRVLREFSVMPISAAGEACEMCTSADARQSATGFARRSFLRKNMKGT